ncbi:MAG: hypothetical protein U0231_10405 [Nitrospiraceae bacterium]
MPIAYAVTASTDGRIGLQLVLHDRRNQKDLSNKSGNGDGKDEDIFNAISVT